MTYITMKVELFDPSEPQDLFINSLPKGPCCSITQIRVVSPDGNEKYPEINKKFVEWLSKQRIEL